MVEYYKDLENNYYRLICRAVSAGIDKNEIVVYQQLFDKGEYIAIPSSQSGMTRVMDDKEIKLALQQCPKDLNPKYHFPYICYEYEMPKMRKEGSFSKSVKSMKSILTNKNIIDKSILDGIENDDQLENKALTKIDNYHIGDENLEEIFSLIQLWGGSSGRGLYVYKDKKGLEFDWINIEPSYSKLVKSCLDTKQIDEQSIKNLVSVVKEIDEDVANFSVSFITKHVRFWLHQSLKDDALPIYDSIMAMEIKRKSSAYITDLVDYWKVMVAKAKREGISLMSLERQIFLHAIEIRK